MRPTDLPFLITTTASPVSATPSTTERNFSLHSSAFMVFVTADRLVIVGLAGGILAEMDAEG
jgi:hypothetical protein